METKEFIVHDRLGPVIVQGRILSVGGYGEQTQKLRWTDMTLYRIDSEQGYRYLLETVARSRVYHRLDGGRCVRERHLRTTAGELRKRDAAEWTRLAPCHLCAPGALKGLDGAFRIAQEGDDSSFFVCTDAPDIVNQIYRHKGEVSLLAARVLQNAARNDRAIENALKNPRRI